MKVGDLVTTVWKGYFRVVAIRNVYRPKASIYNYRAFVPEGDPNAGEYCATLVDVIQEYDSKGNPRKTKIPQTCSSKLCKSAIEELNSVCLDLYITRERLLKIKDIENKI